MTRSARRLLLPLLTVALLGSAGPALAHRLVVFATVDGEAIVGDAFFVGGGRPSGIEVRLRDASGRDVGRATTDDTGNFRLVPPAPGSFTVVVDSGDGHVAKAHIAADRFAPPASATSDRTSASTPPSASATSPAAALPSAPASEAAPLTSEIERAVDRAVARATRPLLEAYERAEARLRFNDLVGGLGMIVGLVGAALWASARRRGRAEREDLRR